MRDYSKVSGKFWTGPTGKKIKAAGAEAQVLAMYLLTSPHSNMLGLYYCPVPFICHETGISLEGAIKALKSLNEAGFCAYDGTSEHVWVYEMAKYQVSDKLKQTDLRVKGVNKDYQSLPDNPYLLGFFEKYSVAFHLENPRGEEAPSKPLASQEQEQEQEQEKEKPSASGDAAEVYLTKKKRKLKGIQLSMFKEFWTAFTYPKGKAEAADAWLDLKVSEQTHREIIAGAIAETSGRKALVDSGKTPKMAQGWLSGRRWEDSAVEVSNIAPWHTTAPGIRGKGRELGISEDDYGIFPEFRAAVFEAAKQNTDRGAQS